MMKMITLILFLLTNTVLAEDLVSTLGKFKNSEEFKTLKKAYEHYRKDKKKAKKEDQQINWVIREEGREMAYLTEEDPSNRESGIVCGGCPSVRRLAGEVNSILQNLAAEDHHPELLHEVGQLEGMFYVSMDQAHSPGENDADIICNRYEMTNYLNPKFNDFNREMAVLVWDETIDMNRIGSIQMRMAGKRIYYFKSGGEGKEKVIRVEVVGKDKAKITYFHMLREGEEKPGPLNPKVAMEQKKADKKTGEESPPQKKNFWGFESQLEKGPSDESYIEGSVGLSVEHKSGIPRQINIIDLSAKQKVSEDLHIKSEMAVNSSKQELKMQLGDSERTYAEVTASGKDTVLRIPYEMRVDSTQIKLKGNIMTTTKYQGLNLSLENLGGNNILDVDYRYDDEKTTYSVGHHQKVYGGSLSVGYESRSFSNGLGKDQNRVWAKYSLEF